MKTIIAVDGMGGDYGPNAVIPGMRKAYDDIQDPNLQFLLFAPKDIALPLVEKEKLSSCTYIYDVKDVIDPNESPLKILRKGVSTTMGQAIQAVVDGKANAVFSSGATGSYIALCWKILKLLPHINKVALPAVLPNEKGQTVMLDLGASISLSAKDLIQFAIMGKALCENLLGIQDPRVSILNIGTEDIKGPPQNIEANKILKNTKEIRYTGFIESNAIFHGITDVIVTDGYAGNLVLKALKGCLAFLNKTIKDYLTKDYCSTIMSLGAMYQFKQLKKDLDWRQFNGAPLLGFSKLAVKSHGDSDALGIAGGLKITYKLIKKDLVTKISEQLESYETLKSNSIKQNNGSV